MENITFYKAGERYDGKRVTLVIPPSPFLLDERVFVSLGVLRVAAALEQRGVKVGMLDLSGVSNYTDAVRSHLADSDIDWIGITCTTPQLPSAVKIARTIREVAPNLRIVLGGPHVTLTYSALKVEREKLKVSDGRGAKAARVLEDIFDVMISGDGEFAALEAFAPDCPRVVDGDDAKTGMFMSNAQYEALPMPARHLVDLPSYNYQIEGFPATSLIAQLGCPFHCGFCGGRNSRSLRVIRNRSVESIICEIRMLHAKYGYTGFMFYDDEMNVSKSFVHLMNSIHDLQQELGVEFRLRGFIKSELFTEEQAEAMYRAGFRWVLCGFEAANPRILANIDKIATIEDNTRAVQYAKKFGLKVKALMSVGHPGESEESILDVRDWLIANKVDDFDCTVITTYPGTPYYDLAVRHPELPGIWTYTHKKSGDRLHAYELDYTETPDYYKGDPNGGYKAYVYTDHLSAERIVELRDKVEHDVRAALSIPYYPAKSAIRYEHSMGQGLPMSLYRESTGTAD
ncbi:MAG: B12-binding domain-containing radical SAM protein [Nitrosomonadales bacterium]|nr:B12-binding domain-containing radical SAM protein [Nitrosomonadales bacterium]